MKALQVVNNFLHYEKGQIIQAPKHMEAILASPFHHNVNQVEVPDKVHKDQEPKLHSALTSVSAKTPTEAVKAAKAEKASK